VPCSNLVGARSVSKAKLSEPLVSVIVPAFNAESFILQAIESACSQTYKNIEILVVDDGSHDRTAEIVHAISLRDRRVRLFQQSHRGIAAARNRAISESQGEFIAPLDADDIWYPRKIELQIRCLMEVEPCVGLVYAWAVYIDQSGCLTGGHYAFDLPNNIYAALIFRNFIGSASVPLIRRSCFEHVGGYTTAHLKHNVQGCEDLDLYLRLAEKYEFRVVKEFLIGYRQSDSTLSSQHSSMARAFYLTMIDCKQRRPIIPWVIFRWSLGRQYFYLQARARSNGQSLKSMKLLFQAAFFDPRHLIMWHFYRNLLISVLKPFKMIMVKDQADKYENIKLGTVSEQLIIKNIAASREHQSPKLFDIYENMYQRRLSYTESLLNKIYKNDNIIW